MSHLFTIKDVLVKDLDAVRQACRRLGLAEPVYGKTRVYQTEREGILIQLPGWTYKVVCDLATGFLDGDNYEGKWGAEVELHKFIQMYGVEKARIEAEKEGKSFYEETAENGEIVVNINGGWGYE